MCHYKIKDKKYERTLFVPLFLKEACSLAKANMLPQWLCGGISFGKNKMGGDRLPLNCLINKMDRQKRYSKIREGNDINNGLLMRQRRRGIMGICLYFVLSV